MKTIEVLKSRRSIRKYIDKKVPREILEDIVDCGRLAPTGCNKQPWKFIVVNKPEIKEKIAQEAEYGKFISKAGACIAVFCDEEEGATPLQDACAATENMLIAAEAHGLGACWVDSYKQEHSEKVKRLVNAPDNMELMTLIAVGYHNQGNISVSKKTLDEVMDWNSF